MVKNISKASLGRPLPDAKRPRNPYDRSFSIAYNTKLGYAEPVLSEFVPAGSHFEMNRTEFFRTADVNTAAMVNFDHFIDVVAVPIKLLWTDWDNWYLNIRDEHSSQFTDVSNPPASPFAVVGQRTNLFTVTAKTLLTAGDAIANLFPGTGENGYMHINPIYTQNYCRCINARRLLNRLRYGVALDTGGWFSNNTPDAYGYVIDQSNQAQNILRLLAYQKWYYDECRNSAYESQNPFLFNIDWLKDGVTPTTAQLQALCAGITNLHSVNYRKDFFQAVFPALIYIPYEGTVVDGFTVPDSVVGAYGSLSGNTGSSDGTYSPSYARYRSQGSPMVDNFGNFQVEDSGGYTTKLSHNHPFSIPLQPDVYNVQAIRAAFALDKMKRASAYAPRHIKEQYEARFGFKYKGESGHCIRLGSFKSEINLSEVVQTSPTSGQPLGTIGGKGMSGSGFGNTIKYDANDGDAIIMAVSYFVPRLMYNTYCLDPFNVKYRRMDFHQPEVEDLGLQPLYQKFFEIFDGTTPTLADANNNIVRGYQTRYQEYKTGINWNYGLFNSGNQLNVFTSSFDMRDRTQGVNTPGLNWSFFKVRPQDVDNIFVSNADPTELTDQFFGFINWSFKCNQNMSIHGQPKL